MLSKQGKYREIEKEARLKAKWAENDRKRIEKVKKDGKDTKI